MSDLYQLAEYALDHSWRPIAWTRAFDQFVATIMICPDDTALWRVQDTLRQHPEYKGRAACLADAVQEIEKTVQGRTLFSDLKGITK